jgi:hypothetical protein
MKSSFSTATGAADGSTAVDADAPGFADAAVDGALVLDPDGEQAARNAAPAERPPALRKLRRLTLVWAIRLIIASRS